MQLSSNWRSSARFVGGRLAIVAVVSLAPACEEAPPPRAVAPAAAARNNAVVPLAFEAKKAGTKTLPFAFVEGRVGGEPTRLLLDTGATVHFVDPALVAAAKIVPPASSSQIFIDGWGSLPEHTLVVRALPAILRQHGIGAIISPQLLAEPGQAVVVDFVDKELRFRPRAVAWSELGSLGPVLTAPGTKPCATTADAAGGVALVVDVTIEGETASLALDTGGSRTIVNEGSTLGTKIEAHPVIGRSVALGSRADIPTTLHGGVELSIGGMLTTQEVGLAPGTRDAQCEHEGRIGVDVLQRCAVAVTTNQLHVACRMPGEKPPAFL